MTKPTTSKRPRRMAREPKAPVADPKNDIERQAVSPEQSQKPGAPKAPNKTEKFLALLQRPNGATLDELVEATGWLPHTTRAALTGLKKKGHDVQRTKVDGVSRYAVSKAAPQ